MSTDRHTAPDATGNDGLITGLKITSIVLVQGNPDRIDIHEMVANGLFLIALAQLVIAFLAYRKGAATMMVVGVAALSLLSLVAQIGLGYGSRDSADALVWHLPNGVLLMAINAWLASTVFGNRADS
jgi:lipopolysaccharide export LptBFGC system permease protein LptF